MRYSRLDSNFVVCADRHQTGKPYSATEKHKARAVVQTVFTSAPHLLFLSFLGMLFSDSTFALVLLMCSF